MATAPQSVTAKGLTALDRGEIVGCIELAISSAQRMQNSKAADVGIKRAYKEKEDRLNALKVKITQTEMDI